MNNLRRDISLRQLEDLFFHTFGIVPLDNYNVIGDGITDNRLQIQQAIYDAIAVGAKYIFVTKGEYCYSGTLQQTSDVVFIGNATEANINNVDIIQFPQNYLSSGVGTIVEYCSNNDIPSDYLLCNGGTITQDEYPELYKQIGDTLPYKTSSGGDTRIKYIIKAK